VTARTIAILGLVTVVLAPIALTQAAPPRLPGDQSGYEPEQPIRFSHRLHAGELQVDCLYCHSGAERSRHAGIPAASVCMNCHKSVTAPWADVKAEAEAAKKESREVKPVVSQELAKLFEAVEKARPIQWVKIHNVPDFVYFDHRPHVNAGVRCQACHGPVETMERVRQQATLFMGWCVDCHRGGETAKSGGVQAKDVTTDCAACHY